MSGISLVRRGSGFKREGFAFPGGVPGFDSSHFMSRGISNNLGFSGISLGGHFLSLLDSAPGVVFTGAQTSLNYSIIGPTCSCPGSGVGVHFSGNNTSNAPNVTMAWIGASADLTHVNTVFSNCSNNVGTQLLTDSSAHTFLLNNWGGTNFGANLPYVANDPYFIAMSGCSTTSVGVALNLRTGNINTATGSGQTPLTGLDGIYCAGNAALGGSTGQIYWSAAMYSPVFTPLQTLLRWATDPWYFWYPRKGNFAFDVQLAPAMAAAVAAAGVGILGLADCEW